MSTPRAAVHGAAGSSAELRGGRAAGTLGVIAALVWAIVRAPATVTPALDTILDAAKVWPQRLPDEYESFYTDSPLTLLAARAVGLDPGAYLWLMLAVTVGALALLSWWAGREVMPAQRWRAARLAMLLPVAAVLFGWLGFYDPFTALAWAAVLFAWSSGNRWLIAGAGVLLGFQHFEHGLLGLVALVLVWLALRDRLRPAPAGLGPAWAAAGLILGKAVLVVVLAANGSDATGRAQWLSVYLREWTTTAVNVGPLLLWALFAGAWALVIATWAGERRRARLWLLGAFAVGVLAMFLSGDRPRVFVIVLAPALLVLLVAYLRRDDVQPRELALVEAVMWLAPPIALWGKVVVSANVVDQLTTTWGLLTG